MQNPENGIQVSMTLYTERFRMSLAVGSRNIVTKILKKYPLFKDIPMKHESSHHMKKLWKL